MVYDATGVENSPTTLLELGLGLRLSARYAGRVEVPTYNFVRDPQTRMLNPENIADYAVALADALEPILEQGEFPVVLGGGTSAELIQNESLVWNCHSGTYIHPRMR